MPVLDGQGVHDALRQCGKGSTTAVVFAAGHGDVPMYVEQMKNAAPSGFSAKAGIGKTALQAALGVR